MSKVTLLVVAALVGACGSKGGESPAPGGVETGASSPPGAVAPGPGAPGADTAEAAARGMLDALVKADLEAARRMVPDAKACALVPELAACPKLAGLIAESWEQAKGYAAGYATATLARSDEPSPVPGGEVWVATAAGMAPLRLVALKVGDRYYAPPFGGGGPQPPSTGNELPRRNAGMEPAAARALVDEAVALLETGNDAAPCDRIADTLVTALPLAFPGDDVPAEAAPGLKALGRCSDRLRRWRAVVQAASALLKLGPDDKLPARIVRALAEMGEYDRALASAQELATRFPAARTMLAAATTFVFCRAEAWQRCEETAETALAQLGAAQLQPGDEAMLITRLLRATAWVVNGKAPQALEEFAAVQRLAPTLPPSVMELPRLARRTIDLGYYLEVVPVPQLATGVYHLMGRQDTGALVTLKLAEHQGKARTFRVETEVPGVTERSSNTLSLGAGERTVKWTNPPLKFDLEVGKVRSPRPAQLVVKIVESSPGGDKVVVDETLPIELLPRDYLPLKRKTGADSFAPTYGYLGRG
jgi:tetratricopeptide (TPR) repeat protein